MPKYPGAGRDRFPADGPRTDSKTRGGGFDIARPRAASHELAAIQTPAELHRDPARAAWNVQASGFHQVAKAIILCLFAHP
jgi:hypothetical protein